ncbi:MAG: pyridine nucleotide-disulfide oxidoreductase [Firmicutes bacterium HGW-Firmicutes-11]|nr:MAG: pyridine nucleotide-disulfide oxidoreductase [Firmicutes bacterium HGW-Firmicutes-11]
MNTMEIKKDLYWVGNLDPDLRIFDIIMYTEHGTSYNSYILKGSEKTVLFEASKARFADDYIEKIKEITPIESIEYLILEHTEPDHTGTIERLLELHPGLKLVGSATAIGFMKEICNRDFISVVVKDGDRLSLGDKTLQFIAAPNLHWPDTIFTYIVEDRVLVTCDAFGAHYSFDGITNAALEDKEGHLAAAKYYFDVIIGPFKTFALQAIKKIEELEIDIICTGHGPVLTENPRQMIDLYREWATEVNPNPKKTVVIPYVSAYGYTASLADKIAEGIREAGDMDVHAFDMVSADRSAVLDELYWADGILFGTPTMVGDALEPIWELCTAMFARTHGGKLASAFGSFGWSGEGVPNIMQRLKQLRMKVYGEGLRIKFKPNPAELQEAFEFGYNFGKSVLAGKVLEPEQRVAVDKKWKCVVCGAIVPGPAPPAVCPVCGVGPEQFIEVAEYESLYRLDKEETFIIVGNGAAGTTACEEIRKRNALAVIELISAEDHIGYNRPMLTKGILSDIDSLNFYIKPESWYQDNNIKVTLSTWVKEVDSDNKVLYLSDGSVRKFDKLIIATGASSFVPPIAGVDKLGVFAIRSLEDVKKVQEYLAKVDTVAVIGGGILGLEAAWEISKAGKNVTIIQNTDFLMDRQLDEKGSTILRKRAEASGITVSVGIGADALSGEDSVTGVIMKDGTVIEAQMVVLSTGIRPNVEVAENAGVSINRFVQVNERMETSVKDIFAAGDCAICQGVSYGIWNQALDMGKVAGANAAGDNMVYETIVPSNAFTGMGTSLFSVGDVGKSENLKYKSVEFHDEAKGTYEKLYFHNDRFCGGILIGDVSKSSRFLEAYKNQESEETLLK